jgi:succinoglycan biosynthesis transport protein ExoP
MSNASPDNIDMGAVLSVIGRKIPRLAILSAIMGVLTFAGLGLVAPRYQSEAELVVSSKKGIRDPFSSPRKDGG